MINIGKWITKHKNIILVIAFILLIPAGIGYVSTRVNYDVLSYLPERLETIKGQDILVDEFGMGAFSMVVVEDMPMKDAAKLEKQLESIDHVKDVLWYDDAVDISVPTEMIPEDLRKAFFNGKATMMIALFDDTTSADDTMDAITQIRKVVGKNVYASGISAGEDRRTGVPQFSDADLRRDCRFAVTGSLVLDNDFLCDTIDLLVEYRNGNRI